MNNTFRASKEAKVAVVRRILDNPVYLPGSGLRQILEEALANKLSMAELNDMDVVLKCKQSAHTWLISAAPDLLGACKALVEICTDAKCIQSVKWTNARDFARAAIAKAEGQ